MRLMICAIVRNGTKIYEYIYINILYLTIQTVSE